jgi:hypothetical protein
VALDESANFRQNRLAALEAVAAGISPPGRTCARYRCRARAPA